MMSKITYILGAGASYGERNDKGGIINGMPIVSEIRRCIDFVIKTLKDEYFDKNIKEDTQIIIDELFWLKKKCEEYPTIDTFAKMLYVTKYKDCGRNYESLKNAISIFFILAQKLIHHDLRYDGFIASLIDSNGKFPNNLSILTWNYDCQFELAYSGYSRNGRYMPTQWEDFDTLIKTFNINSKSQEAIPLIKINGMVLFWKEEFRGNSYVKVISDVFFGGDCNTNEKLIKTIRCFLEKKDYYNALSYSWEGNILFEKQIKEKTKDTTSLVIIGYSFPYVNREIDKKIIQDMEHLRKIYIQDPYAEEIRERIYATMNDRQRESVEIILKDKNFRQFFIPSEL